MKRTVRLTESELKQLVKESVITILNEDVDEWSLGGAVKKVKKGFKNIMGDTDVIKKPEDLEMYINNALQGTDCIAKRLRSNLYAIYSGGGSKLGQILYDFNDRLYNYNFTGGGSGINVSGNAKQAVNNILDNTMRRMNEKVNKGSRSGDNRNYNSYDYNQDGNGKRKQPYKKVPKRVNICDYTDESIPDLNEKVKKGSRRGDNRNYSPYDNNQDGGGKRKQPYKKEPKPRVCDIDIEDNFRECVRECIKDILGNRR